MAFFFSAVKLIIKKLAEIGHSLISSLVSTLMIYCENYKSINTSFGNEIIFVFLEEKQA
jgi:hypothetical protein